VRPNIRMARKRPWKERNWLPTCMRRLLNLGCVLLGRVLWDCFVYFEGALAEQVLHARPQT
jgi:hypothetical protein